MSIRTVCAALLAAAGFVLPAGGQTIVGRVLDAASGEAVGRVQVTALTPEERSAGRVVAGPDGAFVIPLRSPGVFRLRTSRTGYSETVTQAVQVGPRDTLEVDVRISSEPLAMEALTVTARRQPPRRPTLDAVGFYTREATGLGRFLHREDIERNPNMNLVQVLDRIPGTIRVPLARGYSQNEAIAFARSTTSGAIIRSQTGGSPYCLPKVYLDGNLMHYERGGLNELVKPEAIEAIEVYSSTSQIPPQYNSDASCGVILIWTRSQR